MTKRDVDQARLSTALTHLETSLRHEKSAERMEERGDTRSAARERENAAFYDRLSDNALNKVKGK